MGCGAVLEHHNLLSSNWSDATERGKEGYTEIGKSCAYIAKWGGGFDRRGAVV